MAGFMTTAALADVSLLLCCTSQARYKNWRFRLEISIMSLSVTKTEPCGPVPTPMHAQFFSISHPIAPAPTRKYLRFDSFF